jgi:hypothetical protein
MTPPGAVPGIPVTRCAVDGRREMAARSSCWRARSEVTPQGEEGRLG